MTARLDTIRENMKRICRTFFGIPMTFLSWTWYDRCIKRFVLSCSHRRLKAAWTIAPPRMIIIGLALAWLWNGFFSRFFYMSRSMLSRHSLKHASSVNLKRKPGLSCVDGSTIDSDKGVFLYLVFCIVYKKQATTDFRTASSYPDMLVSSG